MIANHIGEDRDSWWSVQDRPVGHQGRDGKVTGSKATLYPHAGMSCDQLLSDIKFQTGAIMFLATLLQTETDPAEIMRLVGEMGDRYDTIADAMNTAYSQKCPWIDCGSAPNDGGGGMKNV